MGLPFKNAWRVIGTLYCSYSKVTPLLHELAFRRLLDAITTYKSLDGIGAGYLWDCIFPIVSPYPLNPIG